MVGKNDLFQMNYFVDTHTHLFSEEFNDDRDEMIARSLAANVQKMLLPNIDLETIIPMNQLADQYPENCLPMMGIHPEAIKEDYLDVLDKAYQEFGKRKYIAVGEIGMDLYWDTTYRTEQIHALKIQLEWAKEFDLPFSMHVRNCFPEIFTVLDEVWDEQRKGVVHCFSGGQQEIDKILTYSNLYFGIGGVATFKKAGLSELLPHIPKERIILETDSPYLAPVPKRGKRNESSYIPYIAEHLSNVLEISVEKVMKITTENAQRLYMF